MIRNTVVLLALALLLAPSDGQAQWLEVTPFAGWRFGGGFSNASYPTDPRVSGMDIANNWNYGVLADVAVTSGLQIELLFDRQDSRLKADNVGGGELALLDVTVDYYHAGMLLEWPPQEQSKPQPFLAITMGATNFITEEGASNATRFSFGFALGAKYFFHERFGGRFQTRIMTTYLTDTNQLFCGPTGNCFELPSGTLMNQIDLSAGLIVAF